MKKTYFNHDSNARNDIRIIKLRATLGYDGYGLFWAVLELLFAEENKLCIEDYNSLAFGLQCDAKILKQVIEDYDLFVLENGCFYSHRLNNQIEQINSKSQKAKESINKRWNNIRTNNDSNTNISKEDKSKNINKRINEFKNSINQIPDISLEDKNNFFDYWSELNKSNSKQRFELEKTWDLKRRLSRWANSNFNQNKKNKFPDYYDKEYSRKLQDESKRTEYHNHLKNLGYESVYSPAAGNTWRKKK